MLVAIFAGGEIIVLLMMLCLIPIALAAFAFWVWMLVDCATKEPSQGNDKLIWMLVIIFHALAGGADLFLRAPPGTEKVIRCVKPGLSQPTQT